MAIDLEALTDREEDVLRLLAKGYDAKSAARELGVSVHTVNERLRSTRRKLGVTSSREAVRLLLEQEGPKFLVPKEFGVGANLIGTNSIKPERSRAKAMSAYAPIVGGSVAMSLIVLAAFLALSGERSTGSGPFPNWSMVTARPAAPSPHTNEIRLDGNRLYWNGQETSEAHMKSFLTIIKKLSPQPQTILSYSAGVSPERIQRVRVLIDGTLKCEPKTCAEVTRPQK